MTARAKNPLRVGTILCLCFLLSGCVKEPIEVKYRGQVMGTSWSVKVNSNTGYDSELNGSIQGELDLVDKLMSNWKAESDISRFNTSEPDSCTEVSAPTLAVVILAQQMANLSEGAFDISLGPLIELWGFGTEIQTEGTQPSKDDIFETLATTGLEYLYLTDTELCKRNVPLTINVSGLAKGYAVDRVATLLNQREFDNYLVEVGGELRGKGVNGRGVAWTVGVEQPGDGLITGEVITAVELKDGAVATSGDYRNFYTLDDQRYSHIIDPTTGYPVNHSAASVSVLATTSIEADAWATALLVLGPDKGMAIANQKELAVLMVLRSDQEFEVVTSNAWPEK